MRLDPVKQGQFILSKLRQYFGLVVACAQLCFHLFYLSRNSLISVMLLESFEQIQLGILLDLHAQIVQLLDRCVTS